MGQNDELKFPCSACGKCCRKVGISPQTQFLDRGDSVCRHFNEVTNLCNIYDDRPLVCRVEDYYKKHLSDKIRWIDFIEINHQICQKL
ncbi:MAG: YkgJ family cysteine cluster protein [Pseudomonadales bacterium]|nr:YkgJ family cysteine cluster protein [Pseudomonadales bacterium]